MEKTDPLLRWRKEFPILSRTTYLISNSLGAMPRSVYGRLKEYADAWATRGVRAWSDSWWEMSVNVGDIIAPLIGARAGEVSMHTNVSLLQAIIISCFTFGRKNEIVLADSEFPSVMYVYERFAVQQGARLRRVRSGEDIPTQKVLDAIDDRTVLVPVSHVLFKSGYIQDVRAIVEKAHRHGAVVVLDAYHSVGTMPVDVRLLGVDILVGGVLKWLCGGPGGAFLWVHPSLRKKLTPAITGWMAHRRPFEFEQEMKYTDTAFRFLNGTPSIPAMYAAAEGPRIISRVGVKNIRTKSVRQTTLLIDQARNLGFGVRTPATPLKRGGAVTLDVPHGFEVSRELLRREILVDYRKGAGIRIAPHFYNSDEEIRNALLHMKEILETGAYRIHSHQRRKVT